MPPPRKIRKKRERRQEAKRKEYIDILRDPAGMMLVDIVSTGDSVAGGHRAFRDDGAVSVVRLVGHGYLPEYLVFRFPILVCRAVVLKTDTTTGTGKSKRGRQ